MKTELKIIGIGAIGILLLLGIYGLPRLVDEMESGSADQPAVTNVVQSESSTPIFMRKRDDGVAPETEAALNQFGLSATSVVKIAVAAHAGQPVVVADHSKKK